jgi:probable rRNA maturation factor
LSIASYTLVIENVHSSLQVDPSPLEQLVHAVLEGEGRQLEYLGIILADHAHVLALNRAYLAHDYITDVLSFNLSEATGAGVEGEVYVDLDTAAERHEEFGTSFEAEVQRYVVHGVLHLIGYDDATPVQKAIMHAREDHYLTRIRAQR